MKQPSLLMKVLLNSAFISVGTIMFFSASWASDLTEETESKKASVSKTAESLNTSSEALSAVHHLFMDTHELEPPLFPPSAVTPAPSAETPEPSAVTPVEEQGWSLWWLNPLRIAYYFWGGSAAASVVNEKDDKTQTPQPVAAENESNQGIVNNATGVSTSAALEKIAQDLSNVVKDLSAVHALAAASCDEDTSASSIPQSSAFPHGEEFESGSEDYTENNESHTVYTNDISETYTAGIVEERVNNSRNGQISTYYGGDSDSDRPEDSCNDSKVIVIPKGMTAADFEAYFLNLSVRAAEQGIPLEEMPVGESILGYAGNGREAIQAYNESVLQYSEVILDTPLGTFRTTEGLIATIYPSCRYNIKKENGRTVSLLGRRLAEKIANGELDSESINLSSVKNADTNKLIYRRRQ
jgi:hypothetical protein